MARYTVPGRAGDASSIIPPYLQSSQIDRGVVALAFDCLVKDRERLPSVYDFPAAPWKRIRAANPIESAFVAVRLRTVRTKGCLSGKTA